MNNKKYYYIQFVANFTEELDIRVYVPGGLTTKQINQWEDEYGEIQDAYGKENDEDYSEFDIKDAIKSAAEKSGVEFEYPKVEYTIYI